MDIIKFFHRRDNNYENIVDPNYALDKYHFSLSENLYSLEAIDSNCVAQIEFVALDHGMYNNNNQHGC